MPKKTIKFYARAQYGNVREFIHPDHAGDAAIIAQLTGQKTINSSVRELLRDLTGCQVDFVQVLDPALATR
jgi:hypothetical protein